MSEAKIYLLPGMTAQFPIFSRLKPLLPRAELLDYPTPHSDESIKSLAQRMAWNLAPECFLVGVSFGGIIAQEISARIRPRGCVIISSVRGPNQLPPWFRVWRCLGTKRMQQLLNLAGSTQAKVPDRIKTTTTLRLRKLTGSGGRWHRWATGAVLDWVPDELDVAKIHIHGDADRTFPIRYVVPDYRIAGGTHTMCLTHSEQIAAIVREFTSKQLSHHGGC